MVDLSGTWIISYIDDLGNLGLFGCFFRQNLDPFPECHPTVSVCSRFVSIDPNCCLHQTGHPTVWPSIHFLARQPARPSVRPSARPSVHPPASLSTQLAVPPPVRLPDCPTVNRSTMGQGQSVLVADTSSSFFFFYENSFVSWGTPQNLLWFEIDLFQSISGSETTHYD